MGRPARSTLSRAAKKEKKTHPRPGQRRGRDENRPAPRSARDCAGPAHTRRPRPRQRRFPLVQPPHAPPTIPTPRRDWSRARVRPALPPARAGRDSRSSPPPHQPEGGEKGGKRAARAGPAPFPSRRRKWREKSGKKHLGIAVTPTPPSRPRPLPGWQRPVAVATARLSWPEVTRRKRKRRHEAADPQPAELPRAGAAARGRLPPEDRGRRGAGAPGAVQRRLRVPPGAAAALGRAEGGGRELGAPLGAAPRAHPRLRGRRGIPAPPPPRPPRGGGAGGVPAVPGLGAALPHLQGGPKSAPDRGRSLRGELGPPNPLGGVPKIWLSPSPQGWIGGKTPNSHGFTPKTGLEFQRC